MPEPTPRKFTMADLMILIAGCAAGIAWAQAYYRTILVESWMALEWRFQLPLWLMLPSPILATNSIALFLCRLRAPRPRLRRLFRQPGVVATTCVLLLLALSGAMMFAGRVVDRIWPPAPTPGLISFSPQDPLALVYALNDTGKVLALCWLLLLAVGRWKPEPTWVDRSGRCLGACWIALHIATSLVASLQL